MGNESLGECRWSGWMWRVLKAAVQEPYRNVISGYFGNRRTTRGGKDFLLEGRCLAQALKGDLFSSAPHVSRTPAPACFVVFIRAVPSI